MVRRCFANAGVLAMISLATELPWMHSSDANVNRRTKSSAPDPTPQGLYSMWMVIMIVMVEEIMDDENDGEEEKWYSQWQP